MVELVSCLRGKELLRGRPEGIGLPYGVPENDGDWEWDVVGRCTSVAMAARYWITFLVLSVLPAPDSPLQHPFSKMPKLEHNWHTHVIRIL